MSAPASRPPNPDRALIRRFLERPAEPLPVGSNPMAIALGARLLAADAEAGVLTLGFEPQGLFIQGTGVLQGGAVSAMLDFAMAFAVLAQLPDDGSCATVNLSTAFLRPAPAGRYTAVGEIERRGRALAFTRARLLHDASAAVVATASSTLAVA